MTAGLLREQRFHFATQIGIVAAGLAQEGQALAGVALQSRMINVFDPAPAVGAHRVVPVYKKSLGHCSSSCPFPPPRRKGNLWQRINWRWEWLSRWRRGRRVG